MIQFFGKMETWAGRSEFEYNGSVERGTEIFYGKGNRITVSAKNYKLLRQSFFNKTVQIGTSRDNPPKDSLGSWLQQNVTRTAIASYVGPILINEGFAKKVSDHEIRVIR